MTETERAFAEHRAYLWGLCYRITGDAAESEDLVQETFRRFLERPPPDAGRPVRPWLVTVATRLAIDSLRRRKRRAYVGPWLPSPIVGDRVENGIGAEDEADADPEVRYGLAQSATLAFLVALEVLDPRQRAALVLHDVLGESGREVAEHLQTTPENVRVILHRARKALEPRAKRWHPPEVMEADVRAALSRLVAAIVQRDAAALRACLDEGVMFVSDAGGRYKAALRPVRGADAVTRLILGLARKQTPVSMEEVRVNGLPGLRTVLASEDPRVAPLSLLQVDVDAAGRITCLRLMANPDKLPAASLRRSS